MTTTLVTFLVDDKKFVLTKDTFDSYPKSLLSKIINYESSDKSIISDDKQVNLFYVNRDPKAFKYIVDHLRGYDIDITNIKNKNLREKVLYDLKYFKLDYNNDVVDLNFEHKQIQEVFGQEAIENILNSNDTDYQENDTPLLTQFTELLTSKLEEQEQTIPLNNNIVDLFNNLQNSLADGSLSVDLMTALSNDENMKKIIKQSQVVEEESDTDSLEIESDEDVITVQQNRNKTKYIDIE